MKIIDILIILKGYYIYKLNMIYTTDQEYCWSVLQSDIDLLWCLDICLFVLLYELFYVTGCDHEGLSFEMTQGKQLSCSNKMSTPIFLVSPSWKVTLMNGMVLGKLKLSTFSLVEQDPW